MNFGAMLLNSKKSKTFVIENRSDKFDLKYVISRMQRSDVDDMLTRASNAYVLTRSLITDTSLHSSLFHSDVTLCALFDGYHFYFMLFVVHK